MAVYDDMHGLIGNTPLVRLKHMGIRPEVKVYAKLELWNPGGSVKDRVGQSMLRSAEQRGILKEGTVIVLGTAGNTGLGFAFAALNRGYRLIFTVPTKFSAEKQALLRALGAEVINTPSALGMQGAVEKAEEIRQSIPGAVTLDQFSDPANPLAHYEGTGKEIWDALGSDIDYFLAGAGSGGTYSGTARYLKEQKPEIRGILADPVGSVIGGGTHADYKIEGIGNDFIAETMDMSLVDDVIKVSDAEAFETVRLLAKNEGIFAGASSGAAMAAAIKFAQTLSSGTIVTIFPDRGDRYFSTGLYI